MAGLSEQLRRVRKAPEVWISTGLLLVLLIERLIGVLGHREEAELWQVLESGSAVEQIDALHSLSNRKDGQAVSKSLVRELLESESAPVREYTMTTDFTRLLGEDSQAGYLQRLQDPDEAHRCRFFLNRGVGSSPGLTRAEIQKYYRALGGR